MLKVLSSLLTTSLLLGAMSTALANTSSSQSGNSPGGSPSPAGGPLRGEMTANGTGTVEFGAQGVVRLFLHGQGTLVLQNVDRNRVHLAGRGRVQQRGTTLIVTNFTGRVLVAGSHIAGSFAAGAIQIHASGKGRAHLKGRGHVDSNGLNQRWHGRRGVSVNW